MITAVLFATTLNASELSEAYKKEYTFLKAQKSELQSRFIKEQQQQKEDVTQQVKNSMDFNRSL